MLPLLILQALGVLPAATPPPGSQDRPPIEERCFDHGQPEMKLSKGTTRDAMDRGIKVRRILSKCFGDAQETVTSIEYVVADEQLPTRAAKSRSNAEAAGRIFAWVEPRNGRITLTVGRNTPDEPMCYASYGIISDRFVDEQVSKCWRALQH